LVAGHTAAATYYISSNTGSDANTSVQAQSKSTPWKHLRCMKDVVTGSPAATHTPVAGDVFILKGGEIWGPTSFPCTWLWSGTSSSRITVTVDTTWYTGASWTRPIWDGADTPTTVSTPGGTYGAMWWCNFFSASSCNYVTLSNIEIKRFAWTGSPALCAQILGWGTTNITVDQLYIHAWSHSGAADNCNVLLGQSGGTMAAGNLIQNSVIDGSDSMNGGDSGSNYLWPNYVNNHFSYMSGFFLTTGDATISGNTAHHCIHDFTSANHPNFLETLGTTPVVTHTVNISNNYFSLGGTGGNGCETAFVGNPGETDYIWNNVWVNMPGNPPELTQNNNTGVGVAVYFWNNTIHVIKDGVNNLPCLLNGHAGVGTYSVIEFRNNHCISSSAVIVGSNLEATTLTVSDNVLQSMAVASSHGYTASQFPYAFYPAGAFSSEFSVGASLTAKCTGPRVTLCSDTGYGQGFNAITKSVTGLARTPVSRPSSGAWTVGAYQAGGNSDLQPPLPPKNLSVQ
jgi:hypothetical protein